VAATSDRHWRTQCTGSPQAIRFKNHLAKQLSKTRAPLGKATLLHTLAALRASPLASRASGASRVSYSDADYFNLSAKDTAVAKADHALIGPTLEPVRDGLAAMPADTDVERRDRGFARVDPSDGRPRQCYRIPFGSSMSTSVRERLSRMRAMSVPRAKTITTYFYPVGDDFRTVVEEWIIFLQPYLDSR